MATPKGRGGGVLPINVAATKKASTNSTQSRTGPRMSAPRLRLIVRRLPPGLTESEFWTILGEHWQVGQGKIDWAAYKDGKVSKDPSKPSRPARAYLKVKDQSVIDALAASIKQTVFQDAKNTIKDACLIGPPNLEFAPYNKMSSNRVRHDGRQGTIDQDQEFIDFLQSLTEPIAKSATNGVDSMDASEKVTTTPLVQYLKDKKANRAKEAAAKKDKARQEKDSKATKTETKTTVVKASANPTEKARVAKATHDAVKAINKSMATLQTGKAAPKDAKSPTTATQEASGPATPAKRERERGNASGVARMLQRDLGLAPRSPRTARATSTAPPASTPKDEPAVTSATSTSTTENKVTANTPTAPPTGPRATRPSSASAAATIKTTPLGPAQRPTKPPPLPTPGAKSAFLKHANPSQGVTEDLLLATFTTFGGVTRCEIDKKKGLGYVDFQDHDGLKKAMAASPIKVGEKGGSVVVLENRNAGRTAVRAAAGVAKSSPVASPSSAPAVPAVAATAQSAVDTASASQPIPTSSPAPSVPAAPTPQTQTQTPQPRVPPSAPRGSMRGPRGGVTGPAMRGNLGPGPRGAPRGNFRARGFRGGLGGGRGGAPGAPAAVTQGANIGAQVAARDGK